MNPDRLADHLRVKQYGDFTLTDAVRPGPGVPVRPREGYRTDVYRDRKARLKLPMLSAAVSADRVFDAFLASLATRLAAASGTGLSRLGISPSPALYQTRQLNQIVPIGA